MAGVHARGALQFDTKPRFQKNANQQEDKVKHVTRLLLAVALMVVLGHMAFATVELDLTSGLATTGVLTGSTCGADTCVIFSGSVGGWDVVLTTGQSNGPGSAVLQLGGSATNTAGGASPLTIELTDTGFTQAVTSFTLHDAATWTECADNDCSETYSAYYDTASAGSIDFGLANQLGSSIVFASGGSHVDETVAASPTTPYSLTQVLVIDSGIAGEETELGNSESLTGHVVPEPGSLALFGSGLLGLVLWGRRKLGI